MDQTLTQKRKDDEKADEVLKDFNHLASQRGNLESHWQEIAERIMPSHAGSFNPLNGTQQPGTKRNDFVFDSTAAIALGRFGSILDSLLTPRNQTWHRILPSNRDLLKTRDVRLWFEDVNRILFKYRYAPKANFASQNQQNFLSLGAYGTGSVFIDKLSGEKGLRYRNIHLGEIFFAENHQGIIDKAIRYFPMTARQALQKWGEKCPDAIKTAAKDGKDPTFYFVHRVAPNSEQAYGRADYRGMPFSSCYVSVEGKKLMGEGGFRTFPYATSRYTQAPGEVYGRSPAMDVLPAVKTLNEQKKTVLKQGHRAVDPIYLAHDDGIVEAFSQRPGAMNAGGVTADGRPLVHALPVGNIAIGKELMDDERAAINDAFLVTLFQILVETQTMSATEVLERTKEKGILLAPTVGRQQSEYLGPKIERELDCLSDQGLLPPMPDALLEAEGEYTIEYDSPMSRAQRAEEASGLMRTVESALSVVNVTQNPEPLDHFDWDKIIPELSEINAVPARWMRDPKMVAQMRQGRNQAAEMQQAAQLAPGAAAMIKATAVAQKGK